MARYRDKPKILLVDDKPENLVVLEKLLASLDVDLYKANSGNEALSLTLEHDFMLILLDVQMPGMDGYEVLDVLSWDENTKYIPVIFITANYVDEKHELKGYEYGAVDYLFKPINKQILLGKIKVFIDLYEQRLQYKELHQRFELILKAAGEGVVGLDPNGIINFSNPAAAKLLDYEPDDFINQPFNIILPQNNSLHCAWEDSKLNQTCQQGKVFYVDDIFFIKSNGVKLPVEFTATPLHDEHYNYLGIVVVFSDITLRKTVEEQLTHMALYDHLTELPNRLMFDKSIAQALARAERHNRLVALLFLDLDHFKKVNDTLGHDVGDLLLKGVAKRLRNCIREGDIVARLGGDEFAIILDELENDQDAATVAQKIIDSLNPPFQLNNHEISTSTSIGIATYPKAGENPAVLTKNADIAMYRAKKQGRNNYQFYTDVMADKTVKQVSLAQDLEQAISSNGLFLCYQPKLDLIAREIHGVEALLRWQHPGKGVISPIEIINIAEESDLVMPLAEWVLRTACQESRDWLEHNPALRRIAINLSASQLIHKDLVPAVKQILEQTQMPTAHLEFELTETALMLNSPQSSASTLTELHDMGIHIAIDDFGLGYSSLSYLKSLPIDTLKIDRTFVENAHRTPNNATIVKATINLAHNLGFQVIAEGVEDPAELEFLRSNGCSQIQGFLLSKPLNAKEMTQFLKQIHDDPSTLKKLLTERS